MKNEVIPYKKSLFQTFIGKIKKLFKKEQNDVELIKEETISEKQEIMELYNNIKNEQLDLENVDTEKLYKVMILLNEEMCILSNKLTEKIDSIENEIKSMKTMM